MNSKNLLIMFTLSLGAVAQAQPKTVAVASKPTPEPLIQTSLSEFKKMSSAEQQKIVSQGITDLEKSCVRKETKDLKPTPYCEAAYQAINQMMSVHTEQVLSKNTKPVPDQSKKPSAGAKPTKKSLGVASKAVAKSVTPIKPKGIGAAVDSVARAAKALCDPASFADKNECLRSCAAVAKKQPSTKGTFECSLDQPKKLWFCNVPGCAHNSPTAAAWCPEEMATDSKEACEQKVIRIHSTIQYRRPFTAKSYACRSESGQWIADQKTIMGDKAVCVGSVKLERPTDKNGLDPQKAH